MGAKGLNSRGWVIAAGAAVGLLFLAVSVQKIWPGDFWGQLRTGQEILRTWRLPVADDFSYTAAGREVREVRWLFCVVVALGWKIGPWVLCLGQAAVLGVMWWVVAWPARRVFVSPWGWLILALGIAGGAGRWVMRPELATDLFVAVFLVALEQARRSGRVGAAWWLIAAQVVWVNSHSVYVFGPVLAWMFAGSVVVEGVVARSAVGKVVRWEPVQGWPRRAGMMGALAAGVTAACWVNPYFHRGAVYALEMWREAGGVVGEVLGEMKSPLTIPIAIWRWDLWCAAALTVVSAGTYALNWRRINPARLGVLVIALYLGTTAQRNLPLLAVMGVWAGLMNLRERCAERSEDAATPRVFLKQYVRPVLFAAVTLGSALLSWYVATDRAWIDISAPRETGLGVVEWDVPRGAADFVVNSGCRPQVYNHMREGHYLGWRTGGRIKVFVDGRTDVYGDEFLREYMSTGPSTWDAIAAKWGINTAIVPVRGYENLIDFLMGNKAWVLVYLDHRNLVFVRDIPEHGGVIGGNRVDPQKAWAARGAEPVERVEGWKRKLGGRGRPWYTFGMAQSFLAISSLANAEVYLKRTLERFPGHERAIAELAAIERFDGRSAQGAARLAQLPARSVWVGYSERTLAVYLDHAGRRDEAILAMERALAAGDTDVPARVVLADWYFAAKNYKAAAPHYEAALKIGGDTASEWKKLGYAREQAGELPGAIKAYERSLKQDPTQFEVWYLLGLAKARSRDQTGAVEALNKAVQLRPDYAPARRALEGLRR